MFLPSKAWICCNLQHNLCRFLKHSYWASYNDANVDLKITSIHAPQEFQLSTEDPQSKLPFCNNNGWKHNWIKSLTTGIYMKWQETFPSFPCTVIPLYLIFNWTQYAWWKLFSVRPSNAPIRWPFHTATPSANIVLQNYNHTLNNHEVKFQMDCRIWHFFFATRSR